VYSSKIRPGVTLGRYPQQRDSNLGALATWINQGITYVKFLWQKQKIKPTFILTKVNQHEQRLSRFSGQELQDHTQQLKHSLHRQGLTEELIAESFAFIRETAQRILGKRHYDVQILGGWAMINGMIAEMATGEGKTLTATLPACTAAMAGIPVHVITSNDYLAKRDQNLLQPLYEQLGLTSAYVVDGMEIADRKSAYECNIVHSTSQQITFDYLRDRIVTGNHTGRLSMQFKQIQDEQNRQSSLLLKGLCFAIIDEADSVLIDEARTPLIISKPLPGQESEQTYFDALFLATSLKINTDFEINPNQHSIVVTPAGKERLETLTEPLDKKWQRKRWREMFVKQALVANHLYERDKQYLVRDDKVEIIDQNTGRAMPDRSWEFGLQQLIEAKEKCTISQEKETLAKISYQRFFRRYLKLAGMSGTVSEVAGELNSIYSIPVIKIPTHKPCKRKQLPERLYKTSQQQWLALVKQIKLIHQQKRPLLIGTSSVAESEQISQLLYEQNLPYRMLNAKQDQKEADIVALAGQAGSITVATNMAGRGTDIELSKNITNSGGLHVIATSRNTSRRIDRQLYGRCARQGDPGSSEAILSLEDEKLENFYPAPILRIVAKFTNQQEPVPNWLSKPILKIPQKWQEFQDARIRKQLLKLDKQQAKTLAFTGRME
jgi:preprotein translocase subunit SecA